jgi:hypothetical protein
MLHEHGDHASSRRLESESYFANVREVLDLVVQHTGPGPFRDALLAHWYRGKMLGRVGGAAFGRRDDAFGRELVRAIREVARDRYDTHAVDEHLAFNLRMRSLLLRAGDYEALHRLAEFESGLRARLKASGDGDGEQLALRLTATTWGAGRAAVHARGRHGAVAPARAAARVLTEGVHIAAARAAAGAPLPTGDWDVRAVVGVAGFSHARSVRRGGAPLEVRASAPGRLAARRASVRMAARRLSATSAIPFIMSLAITGASGQLGRLVTDAVLSRVDPGESCCSHATRRSWRARRPRSATPTSASRARCPSRSRASTRCC